MRRPHPLLRIHSWAVGLCALMISFPSQAYADIAIDVAECGRFGSIHGEASALQYQALLKTEICKYHSHEPMCSGINFGEFQEGQETVGTIEEEVCQDKYGDIISCEEAYAQCTHEITYTCEDAFEHTLDNGFLQPYFSSNALNDNRKANRIIACRSQNIDIQKIDFAYVNYSRIFCKVDNQTAFYYDAESSTLHVLDYVSAFHRFESIGSSRLHNGPTYFIAGPIVNSVYNFDDYDLTVSYQGYPSKSILISQINGEDKICFPGNGDRVML